MQLLIIEQSVVVGNSNINNKRKRTVKPLDFHTIKVPKDNTIIDDEALFTLEEICVKDARIDNNNSGVYFHIDKDKDIMDLFLNLPPMDEMHNPIQMQNINNHQLQDAELLQQHQHNYILYPMQTINGVNVLTMQSNLTQPIL